MLFFEEPLNFEPGSRITRRGTYHHRPRTHRQQKGDVLHTHRFRHKHRRSANGDPTAFDYIFLILKGSNLRVSITPTGGVGTGFANRVVPETIKNIGGGEVSKVVNGDLLYDLYPLPNVSLQQMFGCESTVRTPKSMP